MEIPKPPPHLIQRLQEHDKSLGLRFNVDEKLWEVTETLRSGATSHVFYWYDGSWSERKYKPLPQSAEPLLCKVATTDWGRAGGTPMQRYREFVAEGKEKRARLMMQADAEARSRFKEFTAYMQRNWANLSRLHKMGGASRKRALIARLSAVRDVYGGKHPEHRY